MGEEEKKAEDVKKPEEGPPAADGDKKTEAAEESKDAPPPPPPPLPQEIVLKVYMHCEGCARKVRRCLKGFDGVEDVVTDCKSHKVVVKGEKADPLKVVARVQKKSHRQVELISPIPPPPADEAKKPPEEAVKPEEKKEEPQVITVVLNVHMHCEACAQEIKRRIQRMKGVENVEPDFKGSLVTVKGVFEPPSLVEYVAKRTGKRAAIVKVEPEKKAEEAAAGEAGAEEKPKEGKEEKAAAGEGEKEEKKGEGDEAGPKEKKEGGGEGGGGAEEAEAALAKAGATVVEVEEDPKLEMKKNELFYYYYPPQNYYHHNPAPLSFAQEMYGYGYGSGSGSGYGYPPHPPQMFSDENPNACSVM
ncbi:heavy metal-associated isoprenylated plant protein 7-like [Ipomoea triloba]|uniref:heavy metal-associated isoprenylated plant protein 7-like n=1 Tax=Ipomoea triloba TaxID=35885 RepID=UPI00125E824F|nr:heavy metal-associated isoprenylated plant protein 7-like [Ipomoea triloba]